MLLQFRLKFALITAVTPTQAVDFFETRGKLARICNVTEAAVSHWMKQGWLPYDKQCLVQVESERSTKKGRLVASWQDVPAEKRPKQAA